MEGEIEYSDNIVGFLDVLGFSNNVRASKKDERLRSKIRDLLQELDNVVSERTGQFKGNSKLPPIKIHFFSDSITISCPSVAYFGEIGRLFGMKTAGCSVKPATPWMAPD